MTQAALPTAPATIRTLEPDVAGKPSHILLTPESYHCTMLSEHTSAVVVIPAWSAPMRAIFSELGTGRSYGQDEGSGNPFYLKDQEAGDVKRAFARQAERSFKGLQAFEALDAGTRSAVVEEFATTANSLTHSAMHATRQRPGVRLREEASRYDYMHSVYAYNTDWARFSAPQNIVLFNHDGLDMAKTANHERYNDYISAHLPLHTLPNANERLWRVPTGSMVMLRGNKQFAGFDTQGRSHPRRLGFDVF